MFYNVVLASALQQHESTLSIRISPPSQPPLNHPHPTL